MSWFLEYSNKQLGKQRIPMQPGVKVIIGRGADSDTKIPDPALSRLHCEISLDNDRIVVNDLGSSSGTFVKEDRIDRTELKPGQLFHAGNTQFQINSETDLNSPTQKPGDIQLDSKKLAAALESQSAIDRFQLNKRINESGRNLVYQATDGESGEKVAVKVLPTAATNEEERERFMRAMKLLQAMQAPYLAKLYRAGRKKFFCWVAMEWFEQGSIADRAGRQGINNCLAWRDTWRVGACIAKSLAFLESEGVVHRSIRPTNILYRESDDSWVLSDLVVAKAEDAADGKMVTQVSFLPTNLAYTAPERLLGSENNEHSLQADIYSLGAVLTELLTGSTPYGEGSLSELLPRLKRPRKIVTPKAQLGLNELLGDLVNKMTEPDPANRIANAGELQKEMERVGKLAGLASID